MEPTLATIRKCLGDLIFGEEDDELQHVVGRMLAARQQTLAIAEHYTGGLLASWLAAIPEAELVFRGGHLLTTETARDEESVQRIASQLQADSQADLALVVGSLETPPPGDDVGRIHFALASDTGVQTRTTQDIGHPDIRQARVAKAALDLLRKHLAS